MVRPVDLALKLQCGDGLGFALKVVSFIEIFGLLQAIDGEKNVAAILRTACQNGSRSANLNKIRRLARRGVLDLLAAPVARKESCGCQGSSASGKATPVAAGV